MRRCFVDLVVLAAGLLCVVYIINPTGGLIELIPDNAPIVGNLDEATVTALLLGCFGYFGLDGRYLINGLRGLAGRKPLELPPAEEKKGE